jgi:hypothetical protein
MTHLKNIYAKGELVEEATIRKNRLPGEFPQGNPVSAMGDWPLSG